MTAIRSSAILVATGATVALGTAYYFQYVLGYNPCALCLWQRWAYYIGIPLALFAAMSGRREILLLVGVIFAANAVLGLYHAGIEWKLWEGPLSCSSGAAAPSSGNLIEDLQRTRIVPCNAAPWRLAGLSFAGWNMAICAALAATAFIGVRRR